MPQDLEQMKETVQKDLDNGDFNLICSNESTFKNYIFPLLQLALNKGMEEGALEERRFILNILDGVDIADEEMGNANGGTGAIRFALQNRVIKSSNE